MRSSGIVIVIIATVLTGCASQSTRAVGELDWTHPLYASDECNEAIQRAPEHDTYKYIRLIASPILSFTSLGSLTVPVASTNLTLNAMDHKDAADIKEQCAGIAKSNAELAGDIATESTISLLGGQLLSTIGLYLKPILGLTTTTAK